jgi:hypothetical protein
MDWRIIRSLTQFEVKTAKQMGWSALKNGTLLREAANQFDVFLSTDSGIEFQNNIREIEIAVIILEPKRNRLAELLPLVPKLLTAIESAQLGTVSRIVAVEN